MAMKTPVTSGPEMVTSYDIKYIVTPAFEDVPAESGMLGRCKAGYEKDVFTHKEWAQKDTSLDTAIWWNINRIMQNAMFKNPLTDMFLSEANLKKFVEESKEYLPTLEDADGKHYTAFRINGDKYVFFYTAEVDEDCNLILTNDNMTVTCFSRVALTKYINEKFRKDQEVLAAKAAEAAAAAAKAAEEAEREARRLQAEAEAAAAKAAEEARASAQAEAEALAALAIIEEAARELEARTKMIAADLNSAKVLPFEVCMELAATLAEKNYHKHANIDEMKHELPPEPVEDAPVEEDETPAAQPKKKGWKR